MRQMLLAVMTGVVLILGLTGPARAGPLTYQGRLTDGSVDANGLYDFRFRLFDADSGGSQVGAELAPTGVQVDDGVFTLELDFGDVFGETPLFLEIDVRRDGDSFTTLTGRQAVTAAPVAQYALSGSISGITNDTINQVGSSIGIREVNPLAALHVQRGNINVGANSLLSSNTTAILENEDSVLEIVSRNSGLSSSVIVLREVLSNGDFVEAWTIGKRTLNGGGWLDINYSDGVGLNAQRLFPDGRVLIPNGTDVTLGNAGGALVLGSVTGENLALDGNEIMARNNGAKDLLAINAEGGDLLLGDTTSSVDLPGRLRVDGDTFLGGTVRGPREQRNRLLGPADFVGESAIGRSRGSLYLRDLPPVDAAAHAPVDLPPGATIRAVSALIRDNNGDSGDDIRVSLVRKGFEIASTVIDSVSSSGQPGNTLIEFQTNVTVDEAFDYYIYAEFFDRNVLDFGGMNIYAVDVLYESDAIE